MLSKKYISILLVVLVGLVYIATIQQVTTVTSIVPNNNPPIVVIDAGHGGRDGGVVGRSTGVKESEVNLEIAMILQKLLQDNGYNVIMTRENQDGLYGDAKVNRKRKDLKARKTTIQQSNADIVISIHQNAFPKSLERGAQVFYGFNTDNDNAKQIATNVQSSLNNLIPESDRVFKRGDFYILNCTKIPSILVECGFLSTPSEESLLIQPEYQVKVAGAILQGLQQSFGR